MCKANYVARLGLTSTILSLNPRLIRFLTAYIVEAIPTHLATFRKDRYMPPHCKGYTEYIAGEMAVTASNGRVALEHRSVKTLNRTFVWPLDTSRRINNILLMISRGNPSHFHFGTL